MNNELSYEELLSKYEEERVPCEVWSRVMGYHRPISEWNKGKQREHQDRQYFTELSAKQYEENLMQHGISR